jgi:molybdate transport system substrate-binding protein
MFWKCVGIAVLTSAAVIASVGSCASGPKDSEILVSAAVSLKDAFEEIGSLFERQTGVRVRFNLGASGLLQKQIEASAPVDIFASAGERQMDALQAQGLILAETRRDLARNVLVLVVPAGSKLALHAFAELARPEVTKVAIGNPKTVPAGQYAQEALRNLGLWDGLQSRLVLAENVRQVLDYVARGETEAGIVYATDVSTGHGRTVVAGYAPKGSHSPIVYPIAVVKGSGRRSDAQHFIDLALSDAGQAILVKYGFSSSR